MKYKFVPAPGDVAGQKLRKILDKKNAREAARKKRKAAGNSLWPARALRPQVIRRHWMLATGLFGRCVP